MTLMLVNADPVPMPIFSYLGRRVAVSFARRCGHDPVLALEEKVFGRLDQDLLFVSLAQEVRMVAD